MLVTSEHWKKFVPTLACLCASRRDDPTNLALLATESFFRDRVDRLLELLGWALLELMGSPKAAFVSVGIAQLQARHWSREKGVAFVRVLRQLSVFTDPFSNYDECLGFVRRTQSVPQPGLSLLRYYSGRVTRYHLAVYGDFYYRCGEVLHKMGGLTPGCSERSTPAF